MTKISKCLAVFTTAACLAFLGVASVSLVAGPNWEAEARELSDFSFEKSEGETITWSAKETVSGKPVSRGSSPVLPKVIIAARKSLKQKQDDELLKLEDDIEKIEPRSDEAKQLIEVDLQAIAKRKAELVDELEEIHRNTEAVSSQGIKKSQAAQATRATVAQRREDVIRLRTQLAEIRTDKFRAMEQVTQLRDALATVRSSLERLERRRKQLAKP